MNITNSHGYDTNTVRAEHHVPRLVRWRSLTNDTIESLEMQLADAASGKRSTRDDDWVERTESALALQMILLRQINDRIEELRNDDPVSHYIVQVCRKRFSLDEWDEILDEAMILRYRQ